MLATQNGVALRYDLSQRLFHARKQSDDLFAMVRGDSLYERPIPERHRIIFYLGHLEAFDWNLLHERVLGLRSLDPEFDRLFAFGIDPVGGGLPTDTASDWPSVNTVKDYVSRVRSSLDAPLAALTSELDGRTYDNFPLSTLLNVAIEHRLMHLETLSYMLHQLPLDRKIRQKERTHVGSSRLDHRMLEIPAGSVVLGLPRGGDEFGWDNEFDAHTIDVPAFSIDRHKVTNRQYAHFISAGGYETRSLWTDHDWNWRINHDISHPVFWKRSNDRWLYRTMFDEIPLPLDWPVYVSQAEAKAYANWAGRSLPTEAEWQRAATPATRNTNGAPEALRQFDDLNSRWNPGPVHASDVESRFGVRDLFGNGWEWTSTAFAPFPGFEPFPFYRGYSADFFDGQHFVMKGGSPRTAACMLRPTFRNWFQAHYQYVYAGFRCVGR